MEYAKNSSNTVAPTSGWSTTAPAWENEKYIWQRTVITYGDDSTDISDPTCLTGATGASGSSVSIVSKSVTYQKGVSGTTTPTGAWQSTVPSVSQGEYLWTKVYIKYSDDTETTSYSVSYIGTNGKDGEDGQNGVGISSVTELYYCSNSATAPSAPMTHVTTSSVTTYNKWNLQCPTWTETYKYYYTCSEILYDDGTYGWSNVVRNEGYNSANSTAVIAKNTANTAAGILKTWTEDATLATTTINGGYIKTHTIESE